MNAMMKHTWMAYTGLTGTFTLTFILAIWILPPAGVAIFGSDDPATLAATLLVCSIIAVPLLWLAAGSGCLQLVRAARQLVTPGLRQRTLGALFGLATVTLLLPPAALALLGGPASWLLAVLACGAAVTFAFMLMPMYIFFFAVILLQPVVMLAQRYGLSLAPESAAAIPLLVAILVLALIVGLVRARSYVRSPELRTGSGGTLLELTESARRSGSGFADQEAAMSVTPRWLQVAARTATTPAARLRTLIGPPHNPGLGQVAYQVLPLLAILLLVSFVHPLLFLTMSGLVLACMPVAVIQRLFLLYRAQSGELAEMALIPGLGEGRARNSTFMRALWLPPVLAIATALAGILLVGFLRDAPLTTRPPIMTTVVGLSVCMTAAFYSVSRGAPIGGYRVLVSVMVLLPFLFCGVVIDSWPGEYALLLRSSNARIAAALYVITIALLCWRWYRRALRLPQPFLAAADR